MCISGLAVAGVAHLLHPITGGVLGIHRKRLERSVRWRQSNTLHEVHIGYSVVLPFLLLVKVSHREEGIWNVSQNGSILTKTF